MLFLFFGLLMLFGLYILNRDIFIPDKYGNVRVYDPEVEPIRRKVIDTVKDAARVNSLYREAKRQDPNATELIIWQSMLSLHENYVEPIRDEHPIIYRIRGD